MGTGKAGKAPARAAVALLHDLPAIAQMAERGARFVLWRSETRKGKATKVPLRVNGHMADSTRAVTWATLAECERAAGECPTSPASASCSRPSGMQRQA